MTDFEIVTNPTVIEQATRAEIDTQIATAKRYPMHSDGAGIARFTRQAMAMATQSEEVAESCFYTLKRRDEDGTIKLIQGPSVRLVEIACAAYGNIRRANQVKEITDSHVVAQGGCHDLENNVAYQTEVRRRITGKSGKRYSADMILVTANAACAIAGRNAGLGVIPRSLIMPIYEAAVKATVGNAAVPIEVRRQRAIDKFTLLGVDKERLLREINVPTVDALTVEHLSGLVGLYNAIKQGETTVDEAFPVAAPVPTADPKAFVPIPEAPVDDKKRKPAAAQEVNNENR